MNYPCSLCGSRDWPSENTTCPLCRAEPEDTEDDYEQEMYYREKLNGSHGASLLRKILHAPEGMDIFSLEFLNHVRSLTVSLHHPLRHKGVGEGDEGLPQ